MTRTPQKPPRPGPAVPPFPLPYTTVDVVIFTVLVRTYLVRGLTAGGIKD